MDPSYSSSVNKLFVDLNNVIKENDIDEVKKYIRSVTVQSRSVDGVICRNYNMGIKPLSKKSGKLTTKRERLPKNHITFCSENGNLPKYIRITPWPTGSNCISLKLYLDEKCYRDGNTTVNIHLDDASTIFNFIMTHLHELNAVFVVDPRKEI